MGLPTKCPRCGREIEFVEKDGAPNRLVASCKCANGSSVLEINKPAKADLRKPSGDSVEVKLDDNA